jgi:putative transcriptional regulator
MAIIINLDVRLAQQKMRLNELADAVGITLSNLSILKTGKAKAIRFSTLEAICDKLKCQPGDILEFRKVKKMPPKATAAAAPKGSPHLNHGPAVHNSAAPVITAAPNSPGSPPPKTSPLRITN